MDQGFQGLVRRGWDLHAVSLLNPQYQRNASFGLWPFFDRTGTVDSLPSGYLPEGRFSLSRVPQ